MASLGTSEILIILMVVLLLFGSSKLPQLARSLGKSARILKAETHGLRGDDPEDEQPPAPGDARERAARLREEADRLEREATAADGTGPVPQGTASRVRRVGGTP